MSKKILVAIIVLAMFALGTTAYYIVLTNQEETAKYIVPNVLEPYIKIQKNEELSSKDLVLNGENNEMDYYFDLYNFDEETKEYSTLEITPYVKLAVEQEIADEEGSEFVVPEYVNIRLFKIQDISLGLVDGNYTEITAKGSEGSGYEEYFECSKLGRYDENNNSNNIAHYLAKITLDTESDQYNNLTDNISQKFKVILGYKK